MAETSEINYRWVFIALLVVLVIVVLGVMLNSSQSSDALKIAVVAPMTGEYNLDGQDTLNGIQLYIDQVNAEGGIHGKQIELIVKDDQNIADLAEQRAQEIADENEALIVIGHAFSSSSIRAGEIYEKHQIPAISGSATAESVTQDREWYFRVIPNSSSQSTFLANYLWHILDQDTATVIHDVDAFGTSLAEPFKLEFEKLGGEVTYMISIDPDSGDLDEQYDEIIKTLLKDEAGEVGAIYLAMHVPEGVTLVPELKRRGFNDPIFGPSAFSNINFVEGFKRFPEELKSPGYFSDGVLAVSPVIFDVAGKAGQDFRDAYVDKYDCMPGSKAATNYDAVVMAIEAIRESGISGESDQRAADREKIRNYLAGINSHEKAIDGVTGLLFFNEQGNVVKPVTIGVYEKQHRISAMTQLSPVMNVDRMLSSDLDLMISRGEIILIDDQYLRRTDIVYTGMDFIEVTNLNVKNSSYVFDFYLWFRFQEGVDGDKIVFTNGSRGTTLGAPIAERTQDEVAYRLYRVKADFIGDFQFQDYPFDHQELEIRFRHVAKTRDNIIYVIDFQGMELSDEVTALDKITSSENQVLKIGSWHPLNASFFQGIQINRSTLGDPLNFGAASDIEYSLFNAVIEIERNTLSFSLKNMLPLVAVTILAYLSIFLPPDQFAVKNAIGRGALLTVAFFHIKLSNDLPGIGYTVALDFLFYTMYGLIVIDLIVSVIARQAAKNENRKLADRLILAEKIFYPLVILAGLIIFALQYGII